MNAQSGTNIRLVRKLGRVQALVDGDPVTRPVKLVWARPISGKGREVSVVDDNKKEVAMLDGLHVLEPASRRIAEEELDRRYLVPRVKRVVRTRANFGNRYWDVETDRGRRNFVMKHPSVNVTWLTDDHLIVRDALGNRYEIESLSALDSASQAFVNRVV